MAARWALDKQRDSTPIDPNGFDTAFMFSCCKMQNPYAYVPRFTIDRQAVDWMVRDNFRNRLPMEPDETKYQHRGHAKYADIARLLGSFHFYEGFMLEEHEHWQTVKANTTSSSSCYWSNSDEPFFAEFPHYSLESRTLRFSIKAGQDLTPLLHFWGVHHSNYPLLKDMHVARGL